MSFGFKGLKYVNVLRMVRFLFPFLEYFEIIYFNHLFSTREPEKILKLFNFSYINLNQFLLLRCNQIQNTPCQRLTDC
jgi:hypothetical protein